MKKELSKNPVAKLTMSAMFLALCMVLPLLTGQIPEIGKALSPMHIPVLICGFVCGWPYGLAVGFIAPLLRFLIFGMPPIFPTGIAMAFELAAYGAMSGILYKVFPKKIQYIYVTLIASMLGGRVIWGIVRFIIAGLSGTKFPFEAFLTGAFVSAVPGIICHIALIPLIIIAMKKAKLIANE
ncbi:MAG: ECF transporter S component [Clostridiales bacterium]|nr:ECF transporter S component [Clostridiales bacterium]